MKSQCCIDSNLSWLTKCPSHQESTLPFGGIQPLVAGRFFSCRRLVSPMRANRDKFAFMAQAWLDADFQICYLSEQHRQKADKTAVAVAPIMVWISKCVLNQIRSQFTPYHACFDCDGWACANRQPYRLFTHNVNVAKPLMSRNLANLPQRRMLFALGRRWWKAGRDAKKIRAPTPQNSCSNLAQKCLSKTTPTQWLQMAPWAK